MAFLEVGDEPEPQPIPSRDEVLAEIEDWKRRVRAVYDDIMAWLPAAEGYAFDLSKTHPVHENLMKLHDLPPYEFPVLRVTLGGRPALQAMPDGRWVMFTRGRIALLSGGKQWSTLLAKETGEGDLEWIVRVAGRWPAKLPWTRETLRSLPGVRG